MGTGEDLEAYMAAKNDPNFVESPVAQPKSNSPLTEGATFAPQ